MHENFSIDNPDEAQVLMRIDKASRDARLAEANAEVQRRMDQIESMGETINPYDLGQMAHIFEPLRILYRRYF